MKICVFILILFSSSGIAAVIPESNSIDKNNARFNDVLTHVDSTTVIRYNNPLLLAFYRKTGFETSWDKDENRQALISIIYESARDGLNPEDYNIGNIILTERTFIRLSEAEKTEYDILLTISAQKYLRHLTKGKLNPKKIYHNWDLPENTIDVNENILAGISGDSLSAVFHNCRPKHAMYSKLMKSLTLINIYPKDNLKFIDTKDRKLKRNNYDSVMIDIKKRLMYWKDMPPKKKLTPVYDADTFKAVKKFQARHGLAADGVIGKQTVEALNITREQRRRQIISNLERWRWFPRDMGEHYFIVNIPEYVLTVVKNNDTITRKKVVVGKEDRMTPVLSSIFSEIIFNPTWTIPPTIIREDLVPDARKDRNYFTKKEITIYDFSGNIIAPEDWQPAKAKNYRYVQSPGRHNSLGSVKFNFPNNYLVYLHDTNIKSLFWKSNRSLSSGCTRVEDPLELAAYMLDDPEWTPERISEVIEAKETKTVSLKEKIALHQLYWTAWSEGDILVFREDIYDLDQKLYERLRK
ncbi:MAG TPA: L,D-transpeptidase family protein [Flavobacterium sp.]|jgi:murein L,D-transpeptidase YcbB/YkuD